MQDRTRPARALKPGMGLTARPIPAINRGECGPQVAVGEPDERRTGIYRLLIPMMSLGHSEIMSLAVPT